MKSILKKLTLALALSFSMIVLSSCEDLTTKELDDIACTSCSSEEPPPPGDED